MIVLRDYQTEAVEGLRQKFRAGSLRPVLSSPTGSGKTEVAMHMVSQVIAKGRRCAFVCDLLTLVSQTSDRFRTAGIEHEVIQGRRKVNYAAQVFVVSSQTLERHPQIVTFLKTLDIVFVDECHTQRRMLLEALSKAGVKVVGLTATPFSKGMGNWWDGIVTSTTTNELIRSGNLCPIRVFEGEEEVEMEGAKTNNKGEWADSEVEERSGKIIGAIVPEWVKHVHLHFGGPVQTLVFTRTIKQGAEICRQFVDAGYAFEQVTAHDNPKERIETMSRFRNGVTVGLVSCNALAKGLDVPTVRVLVDMNPLRRSLSMHIQKLGRVMRTDDGKEYALVIDHVGNWSGFYEEAMEFFEHGVETLDTHLDNTIRKPRKTRRRSCPRCKYVLPPKAEECPNCGADVRAHNTIHSTPGSMKETQGADGEARAVKNPWPTIVFMANEKYTDQVRAKKWAIAQYKNLTGKFPRQEWTPSPEPCPVTMQKVEEQFKKYVNSQIRRSYGRRRQADADASK